MNTSNVNSGYYWTECNTYDDDDDDDADDAGKLGGPSTGLLVLFITYCFEFLVGAPSNLWLICHILRKRSKVAGVLPADFFPFYLALTQLLFYLSLPLVFANHFVWQSSYVLVGTTFLTGMMLFSKPLLLCLVCVERYMAVVRPLDYLRFKARKYRWGCLAVAWCIYVLMASASLLKRSSILVCTVFFLVLVMDTICCLSILKTLQKPPPEDRKMMEKRKKEDEEGKTHRTGSQVERTEDGKQKQNRGKEDRKEVARIEPRGKEEMNFMKKKAFITIAIIQAVLTLNYLPFIITLPMDGLVPARTLKCQYVSMALAAAASCSYLQPLLYLHRMGKLPCMSSQHT